MPEELGLNLEDQFSLTPADDAGADTTATNQLPAQDAGQPASDGLQPGAGSGDTPALPSLPSSLLARAQQMGLPLDGIDSSDKLNEFLLDQFAQMRPYADYGRSALTSQGQPGQVAQLPQGEQPDSTENEFDEDKFFSEAWSVPKLSAGAQWALDHGALEVDERGMIVPKAGLEQVALPYVKELNDYQAAKIAQNESFANNPVRFMAEKLLPYLEHKFSGKWQGDVQQQFQQYEHQSFEKQFQQEHAAWLYTQDGRAFTPDGLRFVEAINELKASGITDPQKLADWGLKLAGINPHAGTGGAPAPQQEAAPAKEGQPAPNKSLPPKDPVTGKFMKAEEAPKTKQESFLEEARRKAGANSGSSGNYAGSGGDFKVANQGELDNMFDQAWREHAGAGR